jgi:hypothetical protein
MQWLLTAARNRSGRSSVSKLTNEVMDAANNQGGAIKRRDEVHRMAEAIENFSLNFVSNLLFVVFCIFKLLYLMRRRKFKFFYNNLN